MNAEKLRCFIPVGGRAKRLMPLTYEISKPCVRFLNRPLAEFPMVELAKQGIRNFIFGQKGYANYRDLFDQFKEGLDFTERYNIEPRVHIKYQPNFDDFGSADSFRYNIGYYDVRDPVLTIQGDNLFKINLADLIRNHEEKGAFMTIAVTKVDKTEEYGIADVDKDSRIKRFVEKPPTNKAPSKLANTGLYLLSPEARKVVESEEVKKILKERNRLDFGFDFIPYCVENGLLVYTYQLDTWFDVGTPERYLKAMRDVLYGKLDIRVTEDRVLPDRNVWIQGYSEESIKRREEIVKNYKDGKLSIEGAVLIGRHTKIGNGSRIRDSNIDHYSILGEHTNIDGSAIMDVANIGDYATISNSILGRKVRVESSHENPTFIESSVIGNNVHVRPGCRLVRTKVNPGLIEPVIIPPGLTYVDVYLQTYEDVSKLATH